MWGSILGSPYFGKLQYIIPHTRYFGLYTPAEGYKEGPGSEMALGSDLLWGFRACGVSGFRVSGLFGMFRVQGLGLRV